MATIHDPGALLHEMRLHKEPDELARMRAAIAIACEAHREAMGRTRPGMMEYEVEAAVEFEFRRNGAERPGYPSIVGSGPFSTILHYDKNSRRMETGDVVVVDVGAEYSGYSADVTRTYPVSGKFTARQREIYQIVLDAQKAASVDEPSSP
jgi:Xaa-Pro aminopeptidase